jgi:PAS domain S-box-containing protein
MPPGPTYEELQRRVEELEKQAVEGHQNKWEIIKRQRFLESVLYSAPDAIITLDSRHHILDWNPGAEKLFGYSREEVIGQDLDALVARDQAFVEASGITRQVLAGEVLHPLETVRYRKDGTTVNVIAAGAPIHMSGELKGVVAVYTDITDRIKSEEALRESEERFRELAASITEVFWLYDLRGQQIIYVSPAYEEIWGRPVELLYKNHEIWNESIYPDDRYLVQKSFVRIVKTGRRENREYRITRPDGSVRWISDRASAITDSDGHVCRIAGIAEDVTEKKRLEAQLRQAERMESIGTLAGGIAHDFNNLLMGIQGRASLMVADIRQGHPHFEHLTEIEKYVRSAAELTKQLLGFARGGKYEVLPTDINELVAKSSQMFGRTQKETAIHSKYQDGLWAVEVDRSQIDQVLLNIYVNAWQAMAPGGDLYIQTENVILKLDDVKPYGVAPGKFVKISVTDTGCGMDAATLKRVFDPFFTTKEKERGTGLGLASAYGIVKNHDGIIRAESQPGQGATFSIYLPASEKAVSQEKPEEVKILEGTETILLVDDEQLIIDVAVQILKKVGYQVLVARGGDEAIAVFRQNKMTIALVILDLVMPDMGGSEVYDQLKAIDPAVKVLLSSGYSRTGKAAEILNRGCNGFIQKPFNVKDLSCKIREILD